MQFLKILFWVAVAVILYAFGSQNWHDVTLNLWGDMQADIKVPLLLLILFLAGFLPTYFILRARIWTVKRRLDSIERQRVAETPAPVPATEGEPGE